VTRTTRPPDKFWSMPWRGRDGVPAPRTGASRMGRYPDCALLATVVDRDLDTGADGCSGSPARSLRIG